MKRVSQIGDERVHELLMREHEFSFPDFVRLIRDALGITRQFVANALELNPNRIYIIEAGAFKSPVKYDIILKLSDLYGIPHQLLKRKVEEYTSARVDLRRNIKTTRKKNVNRNSRHAFGK